MIATKKEKRSRLSRSSHLRHVASPEIKKFWGSPGKGGVRLLKVQHTADTEQCPVFVVGRLCLHF